MKTTSDLYDIFPAFCGDDIDWREKIASGKQMMKFVFEDHFKSVQPESPKEMDDEFYNYGDLITIFMTRTVMEMDYDAVSTQGEEIKQSDSYQKWYDGIHRLLDEVNNYFYELKILYYYNRGYILKEIDSYPLYQFDSSDSPIQRIRAKIKGHSGKFSELDDFVKQTFKQVNFHSNSYFFDKAWSDFVLEMEKLFSLYLSTIPSNFTERETYQIFGEYWLNQTNERVWEVLKELGCWTDVALSKVNSLFEKLKRDILVGYIGSKFTNSVEVVEDRRQSASNEMGSHILNESTNNNVSVHNETTTINVNVHDEKTINNVITNNKKIVKKTSINIFAGAGNEKGGAGESPESENDESSNKHFRFHDKINNRDLTKEEIASIYHHFCEYIEKFHIRTQFLKKVSEKEFLEDIYSGNFKHIFVDGVCQMIYYMVKVLASYTDEEWGKSVAESTGKEVKTMIGNAGIHFRNKYFVENFPITEI